MILLGFFGLGMGDAILGQVESKQADHHGDHSPNVLLWNESVLVIYRQKYNQQGTDHGLASQFPEWMSWIVEHGRPLLAEGLRVFRLDQRLARWRTVLVTLLDLARLVLHEPSEHPAATGEAATDDRDVVRLREL